MKFVTAAQRGSPALIVLALCIMLAVSPVAVSAQSGELGIDVWTNKGGEGPAQSGGSFSVDEELIVYIWASHDCYASIAIGPANGEPTSYLDAQLQGGATVSIVPRQTGTELLGTWAVTVDAASMVGSQYASDYVVFSVETAAPFPTTAPPPTTTPAPAPPPTTPPSAGLLSPDNATALDALIALRMAEGSLPVDLEFDVDGNGQVNLDDARQILRWAVQ